MPGTFTDVIELLIPELQRRGIFWNDYAVPGGTYRENLTETQGQNEPRDDHPAAAMIWRAPANRANGLDNGTDEIINSWHDKSTHGDVDPVSVQLC